jgi:hypothetical protein
MSRGITLEATESPAQQQSKQCRQCGRVLSAARLRRHAYYCGRVCAAKWVAAKYRSDHPPTGLPTGTVGAISELVASVDLMRNGFEVFRAVSQACSADLVVLRDGRMWRVEVRTGHRWNGSLTYPWARKDIGRADVLAVVVGGSITYQSLAADVDFPLSERAA